MRHDTETEPTVSAAPTKGRRLLWNLASYALFTVAVGAFYAFFAPHLGTPQIGMVESLPSIVAPTEGQAVVDVVPAIIGAIAAGTAVYLR